MIEWFDDLKVGMRFTSESKTVSKEEILRFAEEFDPQPFHLDDEAARDTILRGLAASGWHTAAIAMRLALSARPFGPHPLFGAGVDELRWMKPVRAGAHFPKFAPRCRNYFCELRKVMGTSKLKIPAPLSI
jgi:acyl dehydratase